jgi:opacity protein-like surface antigen
MRKSLAAIVFGVAAVVLIVLPASAAGPYGLSFSGAGVPFVSGDAGEGGGAPEYKDAFDAGWGARLEVYYDFTPSFRGQFGGTYQSWGGAEVATVGGPVQFDDLKMWALYIGGKYRFLPGSRFRPYLVADVGYANLDSVDISVGAGSLKYWDSTGTYLVDAGVGAEFFVIPNLSIYLDVRGQMFGSPEAGVVPTAEGDPGISVPISVGLNFTF